MKRISEEKLKSTLKGTIDENSSSLDFFAGFDDSKPELGFDRSETLTRQKPRKNRFKNIQIIASAACVILLAFSVITNGFDFDSLVNMKSATQSADFAESAADAGGDSESLEFAADTEGDSASAEPPADNGGNSETLEPATDTGENSESLERTADTGRDSKIAEPAAGATEEMASSESELNYSAPSAAIASDRSATYDNTTEYEVSEDIVESAPTLESSPNEPSQNPQEKSKPSALVIIALFAIAGLLTFMLTTARKNEESKLYAIYSVKALRWTILILACISLIAAITLYTMSIL